MSPKKDAERSIPTPPFGKITCVGSHEREVLPKLTEAVKGYTKVTDMDGQLREQFQKWTVSASRFRRSMW